MSTCACGPEEACHRAGVPAAQRHEMERLVLRDAQRYGSAVDEMERAVAKSERERAKMEKPIKKRKTK